MAGGFTAVDLSQLPPPAVLIPLDYEATLAELKADIVARDPSLAAALALPSEPLSKLAEAFAYRELVKTNDGNLQSLQNLLAYAGGSTLDHIAAGRGMTRLAGEDDDRFRQRIALGPEGWSTAGPTGAYVFHARSAHLQVADVSVDSPSPGVVRVAVLSTAAGGVPSAEILQAVDAALNDEDVRPLTDQVQVVGANVDAFHVEAALTPMPGPDSGLLLAQALERLEAYCFSRRRLGHDVTRAGITAALFVPGLQNLELLSPAGDLVASSVDAWLWDGSTADITMVGADV